MGIYDFWDSILDNPLPIRYNIHMKNYYEGSQVDLELTADALDEFNAHREAELMASMKDEPELVADAELKSLLLELWQEEATLSLQKEEEYTERDAFDDFYANQQQDWN
tara:strand:+ start:987 stop:1313 length:327 start_codon:yes stop_codon:yes gene_type:complete